MGLVDVVVVAVSLVIVAGVIVVISSAGPSARGTLAPRSATAAKS
jgi:hypothetical protein